MHRFRPVLFVFTVISMYLLCAAPIRAASIDDPFSYFNVYSLNGISYNASDYEGTAGAAGNVTLSNFSLGIKSPNEYVLHAGGIVTLSSGAYYGSIESGGNLLLGNTTVYGDVYVGGNAANSSGGTIKGDVVATGTAIITNSMPVYGEVTSGVSFDAADLQGVSSFFVDYASMVGAMADTGVVTNYYGKLTLQAEAGINVFSLTAEQLKSAHTVEVSGPPDAIVYINVIGDTASLDSTTWKYTDGIVAGSVLLNYWQAVALNMWSSNYVNILAPFADTTFYSGVVTGNLIVGNLTGTGQVNYGYFNSGGTPPSPVPEPATMVLLATGLAALAAFSLKRAA